MPNQYKCKFTRTEDARLINIVAGYPKLHIATNPAEANLREIIWNDIAKTMGRGGIGSFTSFDCRTRWRSLRDLYMRKKKRLEANGNRKDSAWEHFESMKFLDESPFIKNLERYNIEQEIKEEILDPDYENEANDDFSDGEPLEDLSDEDSKMEQPNKKADIKSELDSAPDSSEDCKRPSTSKLTFTSKKVAIITRIFDMKKTKPPPKVKNNTKKFFDEMCEAVIAFPPGLAAECKAKINGIILEAENRKVLPRMKRK